MNRRRRYRDADAGTGDIYDTSACQDTRSRDRDRSEYRVSVRDHILCMLKNIIVLPVRKQSKTLKWQRLGNRIESELSMILVNINNAYLWESRLDWLYRRRYKAGCIYRTSFFHIDSFPTAWAKTYVDDGIVKMS